MFLLLIRLIIMTFFYNLGFMVLSGSLELHWNYLGNKILSLCRQFLFVFIKFNNYLYVILIDLGKIVYLKLGTLIIVSPINLFQI